jgi:hypothetical protein
MDEPARAGRTAIIGAGSIAGGEMVATVGATREDTYV